MTSPTLPEIEAEVITPLADMSRGAGLGERAGAAAFSQAAQTFSEIGGMLTHYQKAVDDGEHAKIRSAVDYDLDQLAATHKGDPQGFETAAAKLRSELIERVPSRYAGVTGAYVDTLGKQRAGAIYMQRATMDTESAKSALEQRKSVLEGILTAFQRQGPSALTTPEYQQTFQEYSDVLNSLGNPMFGSSPAESQARIEVARTRQTTGAALTEARDIYAKEGLASARAFIERTVNDPTIPLSAYDRQQLENGAREEINLMHQATVETERETRQAEAARRQSQRDTTDDFMLDAVTGTLTKATVMSALSKGEIEDGQAARLLKAIKATARSAGGGSSTPRDSTLAAITAAAGGDREAAKQAAKLAQRGVIDPSEAADVANAYRTASKNPAIAAGVDMISTSLVGKGDDRNGAVAWYMRQAGLGLIPHGRETLAAQNAIDKHKGRNFSTLPAPMFGANTPTTKGQIAKITAATLKAQSEGRISVTTAQSELANLKMWDARISMTARK